MSGYSTETALLRVFNAILFKLDQGKAVFFLSFLDISSAFDTVGHGILIYLLRQAAEVFVLGEYSEPKPLPCSVPQGSIIEAGLYSDDTQPFGMLIMTLWLLYHIYADNCQVMKSFNLRQPDNQGAVALHIERGIECIENWTSSNRLCLNPD